jgi:hypothetical protein
MAVVLGVQVHLLLEVLEEMVLSQAAVAVEKVRAEDMVVPEVMVKYQ